MFSRPTSIFIGFDVAFMYSKTTLESSSRTNILFKAVLTGYHIDHVITITMKDASRVISSIGDTVCKITHDMNSFTDLYCSKRKGYRK